MRAVMMQEMNMPMCRMRHAVTSLSCMQNGLLSAKSQQMQRGTDVSRFFLFIEKR